MGRHGTERRPPGNRYSQTFRLSGFVVFMSQMPAQCNTRFQGMPAVRLSLPDGSNATISPFGAQVLSWAPACSAERLFMSPLSDLTGSSAVRGGVPVIFPQFADRGPLSRHGFARTALWDVVSVIEDPDAPEDGMASATFRLGATPATLAQWPHAFQAQITVTLTRGSLRIALQVRNDGSSVLSFTGALHTYLRVGDIERVSLTGLAGSRRLDRNGGEPMTVTDRELTVANEIDAIFLDVQRSLMLTDGHHAIGVAAQGFSDVVVWNPWEHGSRALVDLPDDGYRHMLCIEAAAIGRPVEVAPGETWEGSQTLMTLDAG